jgi:hypothetical protein
MEKYDNLFLRIINDERLITTFDIEPSKYSCLEDGKKASHPQVQAIAEIISQMNRRISDIKSDMRLHNQAGPVVLNETDFQPIYKKIVSLLSK